MFFDLGGNGDWVGIRDRDEGKLESFGEPTRGSRDSCEDFVVVVRGKC